MNKKQLNLIILITLVVVFAALLIVFLFSLTANNISRPILNTDKSQIGKFEVGYSESKFSVVKENNIWKVNSEKRTLRW
jgi:hypothetical protein